MQNQIKKLAKALRVASVDGIIKHAETLSFFSNKSLVGFKEILPAYNWVGPLSGLITSRDISAAFRGLRASISKSPDIIKMVPYSIPSDWAHIACAYALSHNRDATAGACAAAALLVAAGTPISGYSYDDIDGLPVGWFMYWDKVLNANL